MKPCSKCGNQLADAAQFCSKCGTKQFSVPQKQFCEQCGAEQTADAKFCASCAAPLHKSAAVRQPITQQYSDSANAYQPQQPYSARPPHYGTPLRKSLLRIISDRETIAAAMWVAVATSQILASFSFFLISFLSMSYAVYGIIYVVFGGLNLTVAFRDFKFASRVVQHPVGVLFRYQNSNSWLGVTIYNVIILVISITTFHPQVIAAGIVAVGASVFYLLGIKNFALQHAQELQQLEQEV